MGKGSIFLSTISYAASSVMIIKYIQAENPVAISGYQFIFRGLVMIVAGFAMGGKLNNFTIRSTLLLIYMAIISAAAYSIWSIVFKAQSSQQSCCLWIYESYFRYYIECDFIKIAKQSINFQVPISLFLFCIGNHLVNKDFNKNKLSRN